jgi:hypothetical protein
MAFLLKNTPKVKIIDDAKLAIELDIDVNGSAANRIKLLVNEGKTAHVVLSQGQHDKLKKTLCTRVNENSYPIHFYRTTGGKPIATLNTGQNDLGTVTYHDLKFSLISSIEVPDIQENEVIYFLIDSYDGLDQVTDPSLKSKLIWKDWIDFARKFQSFLKSEIRIIIDGKIFASITKIIPDFFSYQAPELFLENAGNQSEVKFFECYDKMTEFLCDKIFGKVIGGEKQLFSGIITTGENKIVDAYSKGCLSVAIRGSGLTINGNGSSKIFIIVKRKNDSKLLIQETQTGQIILDDKITDDCETFKYPKEYNKLCELVDYNDELKSLLEKPKESIKKHLLENSTKNSEFELGEQHDYIIMSDVLTLKDIDGLIKSEERKDIGGLIKSDLWIYSSINCKILDTLYKICCNIGLLREKFRKSPNYSFDHIKIVGPSDNFVPRQVSCYNSDFTYDS